MEFIKSYEYLKTRSNGHPLSVNYEKLIDVDKKCWNKDGEIINCDDFKITKKWRSGERIFGLDRFIRGIYEERNTDRQNRYTDRNTILYNFSPPFGETNYSYEKRLSTF